MALVVAGSVVLAVIFVVPFLVYGAASAVWGLKTPEGASPGRFLTSVFVEKVGTAVAFVLLFALAREAWAASWLAYAGVWWVMFVFGEVGRAIGPGYSWKEAAAGIVSETVYLPLSAYLVAVVL